MRKSIFSIFFILTFFVAHSQRNNYLQKGLSAEQNLAAIGNLTPYTAGGVGFDSRYEGIKGSSRLLDTLLPSFLKVRGQNYYIQLETDIDLFNNALIFTHPKTRELLSIPADIVEEVVINQERKELIYRTSRGKAFGKDVDGIKFYQVLLDIPVQFIKMPVKIFIEADYKGAYSYDRRYDEFKTNYRYYLMGSDSIFHQVRLNRKSFLRLYPEKKEIIDDMAGTKSDFDEDRVVNLLKKF